MRRRYLICDACGFRTRLLWKFHSHRATACSVRAPKKRDRREPLRTHRIRKALA